MSDQYPPGFDPDNPPSEEEMRAAYEAQLKQLRVEDVVIQTLVSLINLGGRKAGLAPGSEDEQDLGQLALAIDGAAMLFSLIEAELGPDGAQLRDAIAQLQLAFVQRGGSAPEAAGEPGVATPGATAPQAPRQASPEPPSRLWVPGQ